MPATSSHVTRTDDTGGDFFKTYEDTSTTPLKVQAVAPDPTVAGTVLSTNSSGAAASAALELKTTGGSIFYASAVLDDTVTDPRWLLVMNKVGAVVADVPVLRARFINGEATINLPTYGFETDTGLSLVASSTPGTLTPVAEAWFQASFV